MFWLAAGLAYAAFVLVLARCCGINGRDEDALPVEVLREIYPEEEYIQHV